MIWLIILYPIARSNKYACLEGTTQCLFHVWRRGHHDWHDKILNSAADILWKYNSIIYRLYRLKRARWVISGKLNFWSKSLWDENFLHLDQCQHQIQSKRYDKHSNPCYVVLHMFCFVFISVNMCIVSTWNCKHFTHLLCIAYNAIWRLINVYLSKQNDTDSVQFICQLLILNNFLVRTSCVHNFPIENHK